MCFEYIRKMIKLIAGSEIDSLEDERVLGTGFDKYMELKVNSIIKEIN